MNRYSPARKILSWIVAAASIAFLTGCEFTLTNLTPPTLPENPSNIYTLQLRASSRASAVVPGTVDVRIVIDGRDFPMNASPLGDGIYEIDYQLPPGRSEMAYYYVVQYTVEMNGRSTEREAFTELQHTSIVRRNVLSMTANRGPVGSRIGVVGRGFTPQDVVYVEGNPARTVYESANSIAFFVPALAPNQSYRVALGGGGGTTTIGTFRVDPSGVQVSPASLTLRTGDQTSLTFSLPVPAPTGGMLLDVTTDIPDSVIMPEVIVPAGQSIVTVTVQGGAAGNGSLFLRGYGASEITIPVTVIARQASQ